MKRIKDYIGRVTTKVATTFIAVRARTDKEASDQLGKCLDELHGDEPTDEKRFESVVLMNDEGRTIFEARQDGLLIDGLFVTTAIKGDRFPLGLVILGPEERALVGDETLLDAVRRHAQTDRGEHLPFISEFTAPNGVRLFVSTDADPLTTTVMLDDAPDDALDEA